MTILAKKLGALVGVGLTYPHISMSMAKALENNHPFSTKRWPHDLGSGQFHRGYVSCEDSIFAAYERSKNHPLVIAGTNAIGDSATLPADNDKVVMGEWGTGQRLRDVEYTRTKAFLVADIGSEQTAEQYFTHIGGGKLFAANTSAAFPQFSLWAEDPQDSDFVPILIADEASTSALSGKLYSMASAGFGYNKRKNPLLLVAQVRGAVPNNSALFLRANLSEKAK